MYYCKRNFVIKISLSLNFIQARNKSECIATFPPLIDKLLGLGLIDALNEFLTGNEYQVISTNLGNWAFSEL